MGKLHAAWVTLIGLMFVALNLPTAIVTGAGGSWALAAIGGAITAMSIVAWMTGKGFPIGGPGGGAGGGGGCGGGGC